MNKTNKIIQLSVVIIIAIVIILNYLQLGPAAIGCLLSDHGWTCSNTLVNTNGTVSTRLWQDSGNVMYNINMACNTDTNANGLPQNPGSWYALDSGNILIPYSYGRLLTNESERILNINNLPCWSSNGSRISLQPNERVAFYVWINYTASQNSTLFQTYRFSIVSLTPTHI